MIDLGAVGGGIGVRLAGTNISDLRGLSVSDAGDVVGDGLDEVIIDAPGADENRGESYVVFVRAGATPASVDLAALDGTNGFRFVGQYGRDETGRSISSVGDINGDGLDDAIIGAPFAAGGNNTAGHLRRGIGVAKQTGDLVLERRLI